MEEKKKVNIFDRKGELRCLKRMELMKALAEELPVESVFGMRSGLHPT